MTENNNVTTARTFYTLMGERKVADMGQHVHPEVHFIAPFSQMKGKEAYLEAVKKFCSEFKTLTIRAILGAGDQVVLVYDLGFPAPIGNIPSASLMTFQQGLIAKIELFYDSHPFRSEG